MLVTPGFVDAHACDGQVTWTSQLNRRRGTASPQSFGNCGVGFARAAARTRALIKVMEGVEDIPEPVLAQGLEWEWESFPEYMDALGKRRYDIDIGAQVPHGPVRVYAMGRRGAEREPATPADMDVMTELVKDGLRAGALGFTSSRTMIHRLRDGRLAPTITAGEDELKAIARGMREVDGVLQGVDDWADNEAAFALWRRVAEVSGRPFTFTLVQRMPNDGRWRDQLAMVEQANADGLNVKGQVICRPIGILLGLDLSFTPFSFCPSYEAIDLLGLEEKVQMLRRPEIRERLLNEAPNDRNPQLLRAIRAVEQMYPLGDPPVYEPPAEDSIGARARRAGQTPLELAYDLLLERNGHAMLYVPAANFGNNNFDNIFTMLTHGHDLGVGDGGAHCGMISDASTTTHARTGARSQGVQSSIESAIKKLTSETAGALTPTGNGRSRL